MATGASYQPELIELMMTALEEAAALLPTDKQTPAIRLKLASRILCAAAQGVRDPVQLRVAALLEIEGVEDELHQSYARLRRLRRRVETAERDGAGTGSAMVSEARRGKGEAPDADAAT